MHQGSRTCQISSEGAVLDACYTLAGDKVATCSSTGAIQVWSSETSEASWDLLHVEELPDQPTLLAWCHPEHGQVLAVGTSSGTVHILHGTVHILQGPPPSSSSTSSSSENGNSSSQQQHSREGWGVTGKLPRGQGAVSALAFAPRQQGLVLAVGYSSSPAAAARLGSSLGSSSSVLLFEAAGVVRQQLQWTLLGKIQLPVEADSCSSLCWREAAAGLPPLLAVGHSRGGGIWAYQQPSMRWKELCSLPIPAAAQQQQQQQLQAMHWAPALSRPRELLAASFGSTVALYSLTPAAAQYNTVSNNTLQQPGQQQLAGLQVELVTVMEHPAPVWKLEFNMIGNTLACSLDGMPEVWFWMPVGMQRLEGLAEWSVVSKIKGNPEAKAQASDDHMLD
uniref:Anaphase-promoting complex subunit 4 WD40 domain-containing protein n=1 Tax=Tetradesmus obliquus TaxID=3088 RepID=A0A383V6E9_TETOB|eukprot:jgi/Sobl393_1/6861/SZX60500.1